MLAELSRREKEANIKPDPDIDIYMKVRKDGNRIEAIIIGWKVFPSLKYALNIWILQAAALEGQETSVTTYYILKVPAANLIRPVSCRITNMDITNLSPFTNSQITGLDICADTMVGNQMIRGISGGQKKRVTTGKTPGNISVLLAIVFMSISQTWASSGLCDAGEMLVGPARALFMDEISTGLDSSTTFQIVNSLRQTTHILNGTTFISLLQPAPETYDLFDDIILLSEGLIVYQGPCENVLEFFESLGFKCPERKGVADFLQEVILSITSNDVFPLQILEQIWTCL